MFSIGVAYIYLCVLFRKIAYTIFECKKYQPFCNYKKEEKKDYTKEEYNKEKKLSFFDKISPPGLSPIDS